MITFNPFSSRGGKPLTPLCRIEMSLPEGNYREFSVPKLENIINPRDYRQNQSHTHRYSSCLVL